MITRHHKSTCVIYVILFLKFVLQNDPELKESTILKDMVLLKTWVLIATHTKLNKIYWTNLYQVNYQV